MGRVAVSSIPVERGHDLKPWNLSLERRLSDSTLRSEDHASRAVGQEPIKNKSFLLIPLLEEGQKAG